MSKASASSFAAGALAGSVDACFTLPFDTVKTQMQRSVQMGASTAGCVRVIAKEDGFFGFYKGFQPFVVMAAGKAAVRWASYRVLTDTVDSLGFDRERNVTAWTAICGSGAGVFEALVWTAPAERLKVLRQVSAGTGTQGASYGEILRTHGVFGLWRGALPTAMRSASNAAIRFTAAKHIQELFRMMSGTPKGESLPFVANFMAGGTGGALSVVMNNPIDVMKTRIQAGYKGGMVSCFKDTVNERGLRGLTSGLSARVPQLFISQAIQFAVVDKILLFLK
mmetsp:Transcript_137484/g.293824  ORF Transcript_137484/g.293824 Transcript_137484/m.293824 type:complete len:280 (+) Transcript_137484:55-894(+)